MTKDIPEKNSNSSLCISKMSRKYLLNERNATESSGSEVKCFLSLNFVKFTLSIWLDIKNKNNCQSPSPLHIVTCHGELGLYNHNTTVCEVLQWFHQVIDNDQIIDVLKLDIPEQYSKSSLIECSEFPILSWSPHNHCYELFYLMVFCGLNKIWFDQINFPFSKD